MDKKNKEVVITRAVLNAMPQFAYVFDKNNKLVMWNDNLETILGYTKEELLGKDAYDFLEEEVYEVTDELLGNLFNTKEEQSIEQNILTKSGKKIPVVDTANYAIIDGKEYYIGMAIDISPLRKTQKKLEKEIKKTNHLKKLLEIENINLREEVRSSSEFSEIIGENKKLLDVLYKIKQVAITNSAVLIMGEIGVRKEYYARSLYNQSNRKNNSFVKIDCSSFNNNNNIEKDFYSFLKNTFIEVDKSEIGKYKSINKTTLFFEEISSFPIEFQSKLLSSLQSGKFEFNGNQGVIYIDARVIASTSQNLEELVNKQQFSKDLYFYLNIFPIAIPPLRERKSDIPILVNNFINQYNITYRKQIKKVSTNIMKQLENYAWPGNVKELDNVIERSVILSKTSSLKIDPPLKNEKNRSKKILKLNEFEREYIIKILNMTYWRVAGNEGAAKILGLHPETLRSKMRKLKISKQNNI